jgi:hypothetical protein
MMTSSHTLLNHREHLNVAKSIYKLSQEKFVLLQPESIPSFKPDSQAVETTLRAVEELKGVLGYHLQEALAAENPTSQTSGGKASSGPSAEAHRAQTLAAIKREESILQQEASSVHTQIRTLEAQLQALKSKQHEIDEKRVQLQQRSKFVLDSMGSSRPLAGTLPSSHYRDELAVVQALGGLMAGPSNQVTLPAPMREVVHQSRASAPFECFENGVRVLEFSLATLNELPGKLSFSKQRISQAEKLLQLMGPSSTSSAVQLKQKEEAEKLLAENMKVSDDIVKNASQVMSPSHNLYLALRD